MNPKLKYSILLLILITMFLFISINSYASTVSQNLSENFFRLHILANSNSKKDQELKLKVRDNIIEYMNSLSYSGLNKEDVIYLTQKNVDNFQKIAKETIISEGYDYDVKVEIGNFYFPTKIYGNISLPAGNYDAIRITIGEAKGENWWCSLFPPLCFIDISSGVISDKSENELKANLSNEEFAIITEDSKTIKLKFKLVELFSN